MIQSYVATVYQLFDGIGFSRFWAKTEILAADYLNNTIM